MNDTAVNDEPVAPVPPLSVVVQVLNRPWSPTTFTDDEFDALLLHCAKAAARRIANGYAEGRDGYTRPSFAIALMDPTAGPWVDSEDATIAIIIIGDEGQRFVANALAKAMDGRALFYNTGQGNVGVAVYTASHLLPDGAFRYGHGAKDYGASGQSESVDLKEAALCMRDLLTAVDEARAAWESRVGPGRWFTADDSPSNRYKVGDWMIKATLRDA